MAKAQRQADNVARQQLEPSLRAAQVMNAKRSVYQALHRRAGQEVMERLLPDRVHAEPDERP
jgi:hypothetical protein